MPQRTCLRSPQGLKLNGAIVTDDDERPLETSAKLNEIGLDQSRAPAGADGGVAASFPDCIRRIACSDRDRVHAVSRDL